ncbi:hypothetical protein FB45DRAFT_544994 [Roridomyces roridus]|uniref:MYND-type domain-containing protein n=1 Tax=Roridomyces roridus TaxID=1738132 RepID=A0AAD7BU84_9AGAR|nr:hypothetical protein FB45DRAFT_544994 [Roridomyces roridus]
MQFDLEITAFGFEGRHVKITIQRPMPSARVMQDNVGMNLWLRQTALEVTNDVKYSGKWKCSQCGKPARQNRFDILSYLHKPEPSLVIWVHQLCQAEACDRGAKAESNEWRKMAGAPPNPPSTSRNTTIQPLSRSCAKCHQDPHEPPETKLKRCGKCKLIRYCSVACQAEDWSRHKKVGTAFLGQNHLIACRSARA